MFQKLDKSKLPNLGNVWPEIAQRLAVYDPGNQYAVNYMWGTTGIGYNVKKAREVLEADGRSKMRWLLGHRVQAGESRQVQGLRRPHAGFRRRHPAGGAALSRPRSEHHDSRPISKRPPICSTKVRPSVRKFHSSEYLNALASGEICLVVGWSGDIKQAQKRAAEAKNGVEIGYAIPKEGAQMCFDNFAIPKDARNVAEAHAFIDYMLRPEVAAKNSNFLGYANGNLASQPLLDKAVLDDRTVYPDAATMASLYIITAHDQKTQRLMNRLWTRIKTGGNADVDAIDFTASGGAATAIARDARAPSLRPRR